MARTTPDGLYQQGVQYYKDGNYKRSVEVFQRLKEEYPLSTLAIMAEIGVADSYFSGKDYPEAGLAYREFINLHPANENLPYVMYQLGMSHFSQIMTVDRDQTETRRALKEFEHLVARFPTSRFAFLGEKMIRDCRRILAEKEFYVGEFYFKQKKYRAALRRFETVAREYPNVGLDFKVGFYIQEARRRLAEAEAGQKPAPKI
jgi:outer membrane protein assembly factor BamD